MNESKISLKTGLENRRVDSKYTRSILDDFRKILQLAHMTETYLVVCGRSSFLDPIDLSRLHWRSEKTLMASCPIRFWTYDDLHQNCSDTLSAFRPAKGVRTLPATP